MKDIFWIDENDSLLIHEQLLFLNGGASGIRDFGLLQSALAKPRQLYAYGDNPSITDLSASYMAGIVKNHPFVDGNKRVGFGVGVLFLEINGYYFNADPVDAANAVLALAAGELDEKQIAEFLFTNSEKLK